MSLRAKLLVYLVLVHLAFAAVAALVLLRHPLWLLGVEALFVLSVLAGALLVRAYYVPLRLIRTGSELIRERDFSSHFLPVGVSELDELVGIYNQMIDRLRQERLKLQEQNLFLDKLLAACPAGVLTLDHDGRLTQLNPAAARLLRWREQDVLGRRLPELPGPAAPELESIGPGEARVLALGGRRRLKCAHAQFLDRGFPRGFFVIEELTAELHASERAAYEKLVRMMSHEINNSVGAVRSLLGSCSGYAAQLTPEDRQDFRQAIEVADARLAHLNAFMNGFAEVVRLPAPRPQPTDLERLVRDTLTLLQPELDARRIACALDASRRPGPLALDPHQLEQVLVNVLKNAMEAIGSDGRIDVLLGEQGGRPFLAVRDSGPGIEAEAAQRLFTPFFSTKRDGRGLGLTLVQEVLSQHGYDFGLSARPEGGAEFRVTF
ncbi:MAG TPA: ATP-binding protein [Candidatus Polarisedimenticolaceae bacterium]|nr:ATP-binding protein [Candidatus Polarisedimenticolaceae bacterium]